MIMSCCTASQIGPNRSQPIVGDGGSEKEQERQKIPWPRKSGIDVCSERFYDQKLPVPHLLGLLLHWKRTESRCNPWTPKPKPLPKPPNTLNTLKPWKRAPWSPKHLNPQASNVQQKGRLKPQRWAQAVFVWRCRQPSAGDAFTKTLTILFFAQRRSWHSGRSIVVKINLFFRGRRDSDLKVSTTRRPSAGDAFTETRTIMKGDDGQKWPIFECGVQNTGKMEWQNGVK